MADYKSWWPGTKVVNDENDPVKAQLIGSKVADPVSVAIAGSGTALSPPILLTPSDGNYNAFPALLYIAELGKLLCAYRVSTTHTQNDPGYYLLITSDDLGRSWSSPTTLSDERASGWDHRDAHFFRSSTGRVFFFYTRYNASTSQQLIGLKVSDDGGQTWLDKTVATSTVAHFFGTIIEDNYQRIWCPYYISGDSKAIRSKDDGETWGSEVTIFSAEGTNEIALANLTDWPDSLVGGLVAIARVSPDGNNSLRKYTTDFVNWSTAEGIGFSAHAPELVVAPHGVLIMSYRHDSRYPMIRISRDRGRTWDPVLFQLHPRRGGYGQITEIGGGLYAIAYYVDEGISPTTTAQWAEVYLRFFRL